MKREEIKSKNVEICKKRYRKKQTSPPHPSNLSRRAFRSLVLEEKHNKITKLRIVNPQGILQSPVSFLREK